MELVPKRQRTTTQPEHASPWKLGGLGPINLGKRVWAEMDHDEIFNRGAALSYYFLLALFPMLLFLTSLLGLVVGQNPQFQNELYGYIGRVMPGDASSLVTKTIQEITTRASGLKLAISLVVALWTASGGMSALGTSLNAAYDVREGRPWWKRQLTFLLLTIGVAVLVIVALVIILFGGKLAAFTGSHLHLSSAITTTWMVVQWPVALFFVVFCFALIYFFAPDIEHATWYWITPGSVIGVLLWIVASVGFKVYLSFFNSYAKTYGSLAGVVVLMLWFYITGLALLIGGEINAEIEHAAAEHGRADAKAEGEKEAPAA
jgi:membrane protein